MLTLLVSLFAISGCAVNPVTGKKELTLYSTEDEIAIGREHYFTAQQSSGGLYKVDAALTEYVASVGHRMTTVSDRVLPYEFVVLNDSSPNAWALPGGKIGINRGLLVELDNEAELAAVLGHEIVHTAARHGAHAKGLDLIMEGVLLGAALLGKNLQYSDYIIGGGQVAFHLTRRKYGRDDEREADYYAMKYMHAAGYDTAAAVTLQEKFTVLSKNRDSNWLVGLFASHPPSTERVDANRRALMEFPAGGELGRSSYQEQVGYLRTRQDAYDKSDRARQLLDKGNSEVALALINAAIEEEPREPLFYGVKGDVLAYQQRHRDAVREYDGALERDSGYFRYYLGRGLSLHQLGEREQARVALEQSNRLLETAQATYALGAIYLADGNRTRAKSFFQTASQARGGIGEAARAAFLELDIPDRPGYYVKADVFLEEDGQIVLEVRNSTGYDLHDVMVRIIVEIEDEEMYRRVPVGRLAGYALKAVSSGLRTEAEEIFFQVAVLQAEISH